MYEAQTMQDNAASPPRLAAVPKEVTPLERAYSDLIALQDATNGLLGQLESRLGSALSDDNVAQSDRGPGEPHTCTFHAEAVRACERQKDLNQRLHSILCRVAI